MKLMQGDCLTLMKELEDNSVDLICCDLPYGTTACKWDKMIPLDALWEQYERILTETGTAVLFANGMFEAKLIASNLSLYKYRWVWVKNKTTNFVHAKNRPMVKSEDILVFSKGSMGHKSQLGSKRMTYNPQGLVPCGKVVKAGKNKFGTVAGVRPSHKSEYVAEYTNYPCDVLEFDEPTKKLHTSEKPVELLTYLINTYSNEGDTVLDNCMGSGSAGVACVNRNFIGMELNEDYFKIACERLNYAV